MRASPQVDDASSMAMLRRARLFAFGRTSTKVEAGRRRNPRGDRATLERHTAGRCLPRSPESLRRRASRSPAMSTLYPVNPDFAAAARIRRDDYERLYAESISDPEGFWARVAQRLDWTR